MSTISEKLNHINSTKEQIKNAIENKGISVGDIPFSQYPSKITEISSSNSDTEVKGFLGNAIYIENFTSPSKNIEIGEFYLTFNLNSKIDTHFIGGIEYSKRLGTIDDKTVFVCSAYRREEGFTGKSIIFNSYTVGDSSLYTGNISVALTSNSSNAMGMIIFLPCLVEITGLKIVAGVSDFSATHSVDLSASLLNIDIKNNFNFLDEKKIIENYTVETNYYKKAIIQWSIDGVSLP